MKINAKITAISPVFVGGETSGTIRLPYMIHAPHDHEIHSVDKEKLEIFIKSIGAFYRDCDKSNFGKRAFSEVFRDRVFASLTTTTISQFFSNLLKHLPVTNDSFYQYVVKFAMNLSEEENRHLLEWARENIDMFVAIAIYYVDSYNFRGDFILHDDMLKIESDYMVPVIPGNSFRGLMRDLLMAYVIQKIYGENPNKVLTAKQYHTLFSGGMLTSSGGFVNIESKRLFREKMPFLSILGAMIGNEDLPGKIKVNFGKLDCLEFNKFNSRPGFSYLKEYFMTRNDNYEGEVEEEFKKEISGNSVQMIYSVLAIESGAQFNWSIEYYYLSKMEKVFFDLMLHLFIQNGHIGGLSRAGFGKIKVDLLDYSLNYSEADKFLSKNQEVIREIIKGL